MSKTVPGAEKKVAPLKLADYDTKSSLAFNGAVWEALTDMAHALNKVSRSRGQGRVSMTSIISTCIQDFRLKPEDEQLALLKQHAK